LRGSGGFLEGGYEVTFRYSLLVRDWAALGVTGTELVHQVAGVYILISPLLEELCNEIYHIPSIEHLRHWTAVPSPLRPPPISQWLVFRPKRMMSAYPYYIRDPQLSDSSTGTH
jgi:hypothetical protein